MSFLLVLLEEKPAAPPAPAARVAAVVPPKDAPPKAAAEPTVPVPPPSDKAQERPGVPVKQLDSREIAVEPPYVIVDGITFAAGPVTIRLAGLDGPPARAACRDQNGHVWACGLQARAALNNETRQRNVACTIVGRSDDVVQATCTVEGDDLGRRLLAEGWARQAGDGPAAYADAAESARAAGRGLWNGGWAIVDQGPGQQAGAGLRRRGLDEANRQVPPRSGQEAN
jgi:endonuclease YncB( thermonuclease family)